jgi:hypothetical protein
MYSCLSSCLFFLFKDITCNRVFLLVLFFLFKDITCNRVVFLVCFCCSNTLHIIVSFEVLVSLLWLFVGLTVRLFECHGETGTVFSRSSY